MSTRTRRSTRSKYRKQNRQVDSDEEMADDFLNHLMKRQKLMKKRTPAKKTTARKRTPKNAQPPNAAVVVDSEIASTHIGENAKENLYNKIQSKLSKFFEPLASDDEDETVSKTNDLSCGTGSTSSSINHSHNLSQCVDEPEPVAVKPSNYYTLSDSEDECALSSVKSSKSLDHSKPGTSGCQTKKNNFDEVMCLVNTVLKAEDTKIDSAVIDLEEDKQIDSWNFYKKQTDDLLESAVALINELSDDKKDVKVVEPAKVLDKSPVKVAPSCPICLETLGGDKPASSTFCGHMFCKACIDQVVKTTRKCPTCRKAVNAKKVIAVYL